MLKPISETMRIQAQQAPKTVWWPWPVCAPSNPVGEPAVLPTSWVGAPQTGRERGRGGGI